MTLLTVLASTLLAVPAAAGDKERGSQATVDPCNSWLAAQVGPDGLFNIGAFPDPANCGATTGSWDIMYRWPGGPWSSFSTVRIDGAANVYGSSGTQIEPPTDVDPATNRSKWQIGDIEVTQTLQIVFNYETGQPDVARITYTTRNTGAASHNVGLRVMIDTEINVNDGAYFRVPGLGLVTLETEFLGASVPDALQAWFSLDDSDHVAFATLKSAGATAPDRLVLGGWPHLYDTSYDYAIDPSYDCTTVGYPDCAYALYWNPASLAAGASRTYVTFYGLGELQVDLQPPLALGVTAPATLSVVGSQYSPNPFDVVATVLNNGAATATNVQLTLTLPTGLSLASGSPTQSIGDLAVGQERQVSWSVLAAPQSSQTTLTYSVTAVGSNTEPKTLERQISIPPMTGCGNTVVEPPEQCDPSLANSPQCTQSSSWCSGVTLCARDAYGDCTSQCACSSDAGSCGCQVGQCGAQCATSADCAPGMTCSACVCVGGTPAAAVGGVAELPEAAQPPPRPSGSSDPLYAVLAGALAAAGVALAAGAWYVRRRWLR